MHPATIYCATCGAVNSAQAARCFACGNPPLRAASGESGPLASSANGAAAGSSAPASLLRQRYRVLRQVGTGGFGAVYQAEDMQLGNRLVALKAMSQRGLTPEELREAIDQFHREALLLASLHHPNLPHIYEQFEEGGRWYLVMEYIQGETLEARLSRAPRGLPLDEALKIARQLSDVLEYLHTRHPPVIFRDLKPANIMLAPDGQVYLIDFGIARLFKPGQSKDTVSFGSAGYAAPEQYGKAQTTARSDIYGLGATLYHLLSGDDPSDHPFLFKPLHLPAAPALGRLVMQMLEQDPIKRPLDMRAVGRELQRISDDLAAGEEDTAAAPIPSSSSLSASASLSLNPLIGAAAQAAASPPAIRKTSSPAGQNLSRKENLIVRFGLGGAIALVLAIALIIGALSALLAFHQTVKTSREVPCIQTSYESQFDPCSSGADTFHVDDTVDLAFVETNTSLVDVPVKLFLGGAVQQSKLLPTGVNEFNFTLSTFNTSYGAEAGFVLFDSTRVTQTGTYTWEVYGNRGNVDASITFQVTS